MKTVDYRFNLDLHAEGAQVIRNVQQGDTAARLIVTFSEEGKPYPLDSMGDNKVIAFAAAKADSTYFYDDHVEIDYEANAAVITLPQQATAAAGLALCQFKLIDGGQIKASPMFCLNVTSNPYDEQEISPSSTDFLRLTNLIASIEEKLNNHEFDGEPGADGVSCTHQWNGTTLSITSASGTSSANLKGEKGDPGESHITKQVPMIAVTGKPDISSTEYNALLKGEMFFTYSSLNNIRLFWLKVSNSAYLRLGVSGSENLPLIPYTTNYKGEKIPDVSSAEFSLLVCGQMFGCETKTEAEEIWIKTSRVHCIPFDRHIGELVEGKVDKSQNIAGIALSGNIRSADLAAAIIGNINPVGVNPDSTSGLGAQFGRTSDGKPVMHTLGNSWVKLALLSDVDGKMALAPFYNDIDDDTQIKKGQFLVTGNEVWLKTGALGETGHKVLAEKAVSLSGYGITDAYTKTETDSRISTAIAGVTGLKFQVVQSLPPIQGAYSNIIYLVPKSSTEQNDIYDEWAAINNQWEHLGSTQIDLSGKVDKTRKIAGVDLQDDITAAELKTALSVPTKTSQLTNDSNFLTQHQDISGKADIEDVPQYLRDLIDGNVAIIKYSASSAPPTSVTSESYAVPCLWEYNGKVWFVYKDTGIGGRHLYSSIPLTEAIPTNVSEFINDAGYLTAQGIAGKMDLAQIRSTIDDDTQIKQGQFLVVNGEVWLKTGAHGAAGHLVIEDKANKTNSISSSSTNSQYPSALAVKNYVDTVIGGIENGSY